MSRLCRYDEIMQRPLPPAPRGSAVALTLAMAKSAPAPAPRSASRPALTSKKESTMPNVHGLLQQRAELQAAIELREYLGTRRDLSAEQRAALLKMPAATALTFARANPYQPKLTKGEAQILARLDAKGETPKRAYQVGTTTHTPFMSREAARARLAELTEREQTGQGIDHGRIRREHDGARDRFAPPAPRYNDVDRDRSPTPDKGLFPEGQR